MTSLLLFIQRIRWGVVFVKVVLPVLFVVLCALLAERWNRAIYKERDGVCVKMGAHLVQSEKGDYCITGVVKRW